MGRRWVRGLGVVDDAADLREMEGGEHCWVGAERGAWVVVCNLR